MGDKRLPATLVGVELVALGWDQFFKDSFDTHHELGLVPGRISQVQMKHCLAFTELGEMEVRVPGKFRFDAASKEAYPVVGDWVGIKTGMEPGKGTLQMVLPRKSKISRKFAGAVTEEQVMGANVDVIFIVAGLDDDFNIQRMERYLALATESGASPVILLNKSDLSQDAQIKIDQLQNIASAVPIHIMSAELNEGLEVLEEYLLRGRTSAFLGSSGVGKSTIINQLLGTKRQKIAPVRETDSHGRHTTTFRELILLPGGGMVIDNPGMRELQLWSSGEGVDEVFRDIEELTRQCRFRDCSHESEPGCSVKEALESGELDRRRYEHYLKLKREVQFLEAKKNETLRSSEKARWGNISRKGNAIRKLKRGEI